MACAQNQLEETTFNYEITRVEGDLNHDGISDLAIVSQDTLQDTAPYLLEVYFGNSQDAFDLIVSTQKAIEPQFPNGRDGFITGAGFDFLSILDGGLLIENQLLRGFYSHMFYFQNGHFELIHYKNVSSDGRGKTYHMDYNLRTGRLIQLVDSYEKDEIFTDSEEIIKLETLPSLADFEPFMGKYY